MPKICCFFEKLEEIKKKLNKIKKLMGETFQNFGTHGKSVVVERQKNIVIERSDDNIITRKQTIIREKILNDVNTLSSPKKPHQHNNTTKANPTTSTPRTPDKEQIVNKKRTTATTTTAGPVDNSFLPNPNKSFSALELAALKQDIDDEIRNLKLHRNTLLKQAISTARENAKMREKKPVNTPIQNDMTWDQNFSTPKGETIELKFEKFSSEHNVQSTVRHKRDEQTSCRPRMRTIGLQKNTQRSAVAKSNNLPIHNSLLNLKCNSTNEAIPTAFACFDYGSNCAVNDYYRNASNSHSGCQNYCQRYNMSGDYNGVVCNQNTYRQVGRTPCTEYNYCRDEFYYDYSNVSTPQQHSQVHQAELPPRLCYCHGNCRPSNHRRKKRSHHYDYKREKVNQIDAYEEQLLTKKYLLQQITKQQRDLEREEARALAIRAARLKLDKKEHKTEQWQEESAARIASLLTRGHQTSKKPAPVDSDSDEGEQNLQLKKERLKVTKKKSYKIKKALSHGDHGYYEDISSDGTRREEYNIETKRTMEKMRIHAYKPSPKPDSERLSKVSEENGKSVKKEKRYAEYITQYKQDPLTTKLEAHKNVQTSFMLTQQKQPYRLESAADEVGLQPETTDLKSTQMTSIDSKPIPEVNSNKRISAHDGNELWDSPSYAAKQLQARKRLTKEDFAQTDKQTPKPAEYKRLSSVDTNSPLFMRTDQSKYEEQLAIKDDQVTSSLGGSFLSRDDAYQKGSKKDMIPTDLSPLERLAREESLSQGSRGQTIQEQLSMRDHLFRGEYLPHPDPAAHSNKVIDENLSVRSRIIKEESFDAGTRETTVEKENEVRNLRDEFKPNVFEEQIPRGSLERGETTPRDNRESINLGQLTPQKRLTREENFIPVSRKQNTQEDRTPRASLARERSSIPVSRKQSTQEDRTLQESLAREGSHIADSRKVTPRKYLTREGSYATEGQKQSTQEHRTARELVAGEGSYIADSRKLSAEEERTQREHLRREAIYTADSPKLSAHDEPTPREHLGKEGSYIVDSRNDSAQEERTPREYLAREGIYTAESPRLSRQEEPTPRNYLRDEGSYIADNRKLSTHEERTPREHLRREEIYTAGSPRLRAQEERIQREHFKKEGSYTVNSRRDSTQEGLKPREYLTREGIYVPESPRPSIQEDPTLREYLKDEGSYIADNRKLSTSEERTPREHLRKEVIHSADSPGRSVQEQRTPREYLERDGSSITESPRLSTQEKPTTREFLRDEGSYIADNRKLSNLEERTPRENLRREAIYTADNPRLSAQKERTPREPLKKEGSYTVNSRRDSTQEGLKPREYLTREGIYVPESPRLSIQKDPTLREYLKNEGSYIADNRKLSTSEERTPREHLRKEVIHSVDSPRRSAQEQRTPREYLERDGSSITESPRLSTQEKPTTREYLRDEGSYIADNRKLNNLEERTPRENLRREAIYTADSPRLRAQKEPLKKEGNYIADSRRRSTEEERTPRDLKREGINTAEIQKLYKESQREGSNISEIRKQSDQEKRTPREYLGREDSFSAESRNLSAQEERTLHEHLRKEGSYTPERRKLNSQEERTLREHLTNGRTAYREKLSTPEERTHREYLSREGSYIPESPKLSAQEERSPREHLAKEGSYISENREQNTQEEHAQREYFTREEGLNADSRKRSTQEERSPRERYSREQSFLQGTLMQSIQEEHTPHDAESASERSYIIDTHKERSPRELLSREASFRQNSQKRSTEQERSPKEREPREESVQQGSPKRANLEEGSSPERFQKEDKYILDRSLQERFPRNERYIEENRKQSTQKERSPRERLSTEGNFSQRSRVIQENLPPRERFTNEDSIIEQSQKENTPETRTPRGHLSREASYFRDGSKQSSPEKRLAREHLNKEEHILQDNRKEHFQEERTPQEHLSIEGSYIRDGSKRNTQEDYTPRERVSREASFLQGSRVMQDNLLPRERLAREESIRKGGSALGEHTPQEHLSREASFLQGSRVMQDNLSPRERSRRDQSLLQRNKEKERVQGERLEQTEHDEIIPKARLSKEKTLSPENLTRESSFQRASRVRQDHLSPRERLSKEDSNLKNNQKQSTPSTPRENLTRQESNFQDNRKQSTQEQRSPRASLTRESSFIQDKRRKNSQEKHTTRENMTKEETELQDIRKGSTQDYRTRRVTKEESFIKNRQDQLDHKPLRKRFKESVNEKVIPQNRLAKKTREQTPKTQLSSIDNVTREDNTKRNRQDLRSPRESLTKKDIFLQNGQEQNIPNQRISRHPRKFTEDDAEETISQDNQVSTIQEQQQTPVIQLTPSEEENNFEENDRQRTLLTRSPRESFKSTIDHRSLQTQQANLSPRRRSKREESSIIANQLKGNSLSPRRFTREESFAKSSRVIRDSLTPRTDNQNRNTHIIQPPHWSKEEIKYPYMTYSQDTRDDSAFRKTNVPPESAVIYDEKSSPLEAELQRFPDGIPKDNENGIKRDEPRKCLTFGDDCKTPAAICDDPCDDPCGDTYEYVPCFLPENHCRPVYDICQTFNLQNQNGYNQPSMTLQVPINAQTYHEREMIYRRREYNSSVESCYGRIPQLVVRDNIYDERPTTTTTASSQASCSDYRPFRPTQQMLICVNPLDQQLQQEQQTLQLPPHIAPQYIPDQQIETEEELLQRLDLEARLRCCDDIQQANVYYCGGNDIKNVNFEPTIDQNYTEYEECRCNREVYNNVDVSNRSCEQTMQDYMERKLSNCTITSAYATASSGASCTCLSNNEEMDETPPKLQTQPQSKLSPRQIRVIPEYTGCPCMLGTYLEMIAISGDCVEMPKEKDECVKRISFR